MPWTAPNFHNAMDTIRKNKYDEAANQVEELYHSTMSEVSERNFREGGFRVRTEAPVYRDLSSNITAIFAVFEASAFLQYHCLVWRLFAAIC